MRKYASPKANPHFVFGLNISISEFAIQFQIQTLQNISFSKIAVADNQIVWYYIIGQIVKDTFRPIYKFGDVMVSTGSGLIRNAVVW